MTRTFGNKMKIGSHPRIRKQKQIQETMVETKRNEAINQIAVGGNTLGLRSRRQQTHPPRRGYAKEKRSDATRLSCWNQANRTFEHASIRREQQWIPYGGRQPTSRYDLQIWRFRPWLPLRSRTRSGRECKNMLRLRAHAEHKQMLTLGR